MKLFALALAYTLMTSTPPPPATPAFTPTPGSPNGMDFFATSTPISTACPVGNPINYGTLTPDASWMIMCSQCLQPTATVSMGNLYNNLLTPEPTVNLTAVTTGTPTATPVPGTLTYNSTTVISFRNFNGAPNNSASGTCANNIVNGVVDPTTLKCVLTLNINDNSNSYGYGPDININTTSSSSSGGYYYTWVHPSGFAVYKNVINDAVANTQIGNRFRTLTSATNNHFFSFATANAGMITMVGEISTIYISTRAYVYPPQTSYCGTITGTTAAGLPGTAPTFTPWINIDRSQYQCFVIPGFSVGNIVSAISWALPATFVEWANTASVPGMTICAFAVTVTPISVFGMQLDLVFLSAVFVAVFVVRHFISK